MNRGRRIASRTVATILGVLLLLQLVPYGRTHTNPPVTGSPQWDSPQTEQLARRACFDCHSNETRWPWYSWVAPVSWRVQEHVNEGRSHLNFSKFDEPQHNVSEADEMVEQGKMPPWDYARMHPESRLSESERQELLRGLQTTFRPSTNEHDHDEDHNDEE
jgi:mono/diheme cytochrome c family protein